MEDAVKKIIIALELSSDKYTKAAVEAKGELVKLNAEQRELKKSGNEAGEAFTKNKQRIEELNKVYRDNNKAAIAINKLTKEETNSTLQLRAAQVVLTKEKNATREADLKSTQGGKDLLATLSAVNEKIIQQGKEINDGRPNVGNYITSIQKLYSGIKTVANVLPGLGISGVFLLGFEGLVFLLDQVSLGFEDSAKAMELFSKATLREQEDINKLSESILDLSIKNNVLKGLYSQQTADKLNNLIEGNKKISQEKFRHENEQLAIIKEYAAMEFKERQKGIDVSQNNLEKIYELRNQKLEIQESKYQEHISKIKTEQALKNEETDNKYIKEQKEKREKDNEAKLKKEEKFYDKEQVEKDKNSKILKDLESKIRADREAEEASASERLLILKSEEAEKLKTIYEASNKTPLDKQRLDHELLDLEKKYNAQVLELDIKAAEEEIKLADDTAQRIGKAKLEEIRKQAAEDVKQLDMDLKSRQLNFKQKKEELDKALADQLISNIEYQQRLTRLVELEEEKRKKLQERAVKDTMSLIESYATVVNNNYQSELNADNELRDKKIANLDAQLKQGLISQSEYDQKKEAIENANKKKDKDIKRKQFKTEQNAAEIRILINTAEGVTKALAESDPYTKAFLIAEAVALGAAEFAVVQSQPVPYAWGGKTTLSGKRIGNNDGTAIQRSNGDNLLATVKTGEVILNEQQQNALGGAPTFKKIGVPGFADGGITASAIASPVEARFNAANDIIAMAKVLPTPIVLVQDINDAQGTLTRVENNGNL